jgi:hypothetical protein
MTKAESKSPDKVRHDGHRRRAGGRPAMKGERRTVIISFRTTATSKALAYRLAKAEGRSLANYIERLIWEGGLDRVAPYQAAMPDRLTRRNNAEVKMASSG